MSQQQKPSGNKPVYKDGDVAVFLNTRTPKTGPHAGETREVFSYVRGEGADAYRVDVPTTIMDYELRNSQRGSDVVALVEGVGQQPLEVFAPGKKGSYPVSILPVSIRENVVGDKTFRDLEYAVAFPQFSKASKNEDGSLKPDARPYGYLIEPLGEDGKVAKGAKKSLFCPAFVTDKPKDAPKGTKANSATITPFQMLEARAALAANEPYSFEANGSVVTLKGAQARVFTKTAAEGEAAQTQDSGQTELTFTIAPAARNSAPLPGRSSSAGRTAARS